MAETMSHPPTRLMTKAFEELLAFQRALKDLVASVDATYAKQHEEFYIGLEGSFGSKHVTPRTLTSRLLGSMVCVEGIITKCEWIVSFPLCGLRVASSYMRVVIYLPFFFIYFFRLSGASKSSAQRPLLPSH